MQFVPINFSLSFSSIDKDIASDQSLGIVGGGDYPFFGAPDKTEQPAEDIISVGIKKKKKKKKIGNCQSSLSLY